MKKGRIIAAIVALLVIAGVGACVVIGAQAAIPTVRTSVVEAGDLARTVTVSGSTAKDASMDVYPPTAGTLVEVFVEDGDEVKAGDPLAALDTEPLELQVAGAEAAYLASVAQLDSLRQQVPSQADIDEANDVADKAHDAYLEAGETADILTATVAGLRAVGLSDLVDLGSVVTTDPATIAALAALGQLAAEGVVPPVAGLTISILDAQATSMFATEEQAYVAYEQAEAAADALEDVDLAASITSARAACDQAAMSLALAQQTLDESTMTAPIDGVVVFNTGAGIAGVPVAEPGPGYSVSPAAAPFSVVRLGFLEFIGDVDEADVDALEIGMPATVLLDAFPGEEFATELRKVGVASQLTATGGNAFPIHMDLAETGFDILIGMRGSADIELEVMPDTVSIPIEALFEQDGQSYVYEVEEGVLNRIDIETGLFTDTHVEVVSGLEGGEEIVETSSALFADGMPVRVDNDAPSGPVSPFGG